MVHESRDVGNEARYEKESHKRAARAGKAAPQRTLSLHAAASYHAQKVFGTAAIVRKLTVNLLYNLLVNECEKKRIALSIDSEVENIVRNKMLPAVALLEKPEEAWSPLPLHVLQMSECCWAFACVKDHEVIKRPPGVPSWRAVYYRQKCAEKIA